MCLRHVCQDLIDFLQIQIGKFLQTQFFCVFVDQHGAEVISNIGMSLKFMPVAEKGLYAFLRVDPTLVFAKQACLVAAAPIEPGGVILMVEIHISTEQLFAVHGHSLRIQLPQRLCPVIVWRCGRAPRAVMPETVSYTHLIRKEKADDGRRFEEALIFDITEAKTVSERLAEPLPLGVDTGLRLLFYLKPSCTFRGTLLESFLKL